MAKTNAFLQAGGELGSLIRGYDWETTSLGHPDNWPNSLKMAIRIMLNSRQPIWIGWGPDLLYFYNDPYKSIIGGKHPWALGKRTREVWREIWPDIGPMLATAMGGDTGTFVESQLLIMERNGYPEETYYTFSYSPIPTDDGITAGGIICANSDDTQKVLGERQLALLKELGSQISGARDWRSACVSSMKAIGTDPRDLPFALLYMSETKGAPLTRVASTGISEAHPAAPLTLQASAETPWPISRALIEREPFILHDLKGLESPSGPWRLAPSKAAIMPIAPSKEGGLNGVLIAGLNPYRLVDDNFRGFLGLVASQITAAIGNAQAYEEERRRSQMLAELDRAKTTFFSNVSHEFRTPLTLMLGPLEEMLAAAPGNEAQKQQLELVHRNGLRLLRLVNSLLDFSRIESGRLRGSFQPTDIAQFSAEIASGFRSAMERAGLKLEVDLWPLPQPVFIDRDMWEKILLNLLSNAFKFTHQGKIAVRSKLTGDGSKALISVSDTGIGMPADELPKLFERFHRIEGAQGRSFEGSGIGLALVHELVKLHGGSIEVESRVGKGSTFTITLPLGSSHLPQESIRTEDVAPAASKSQAFVEEASRWLPLSDVSSPTDLAEFAEESIATNDRPGAGKRVLLAEDNADMREYVQRLLVAQGYEVESCGDGEAALQAARRRPPDLVLSDVMMPKLDGLGVLRGIRGDEQLSSIPVILLSARAGEEAKVEALDATADDFLAKPFAARELLARVNTNIQMASIRREAARAVMRTEQRLVMSQERLTLALSTGRVAVYDWNIGQDTLSVQGPLAELFGVSVTEAARGLPLTRFVEGIHPDDRARVLEAVQHTVDTGEPFDTEYRLHMGARPYVVRSRGTVETRDDGERWFSGVLIDRTEEKAAEDALRASEARFRTALEIRTVGSIVFDLDGKVVDANPAFLSMSGYSRKDVSGGRLTLQSLTAPEWQSAVSTTLRELKEIGETTPIQKEYVRPDGSRWWGLFAAKRLQDGLGFKFVIDITEQKKAELALREQSAALETLNRTAATTAIEKDLHRVVQTVTDAGVELTGAEFGAFFYNVVDPKGESYMLYTISGVPREAFSKFPMPRNTAVFAPTFAGEGIVRSDNIRLDPRYGQNAPRKGMPDGHLPVTSYLAAPVKSRDGEVLGGLFFGHSEAARFTQEHEDRLVGLAAQAAIAIDNTRLFETAQAANESLEQRVAERTKELREAHEALRQAQKMEAVGQLTGGIAHDFNNLLMGISGSLDLLERGLARKQITGFERYVQGAQSSARRAASLTQRLLAFSRRQTLDPKPTDINKLIYGLEDMIRRTVGPSIEVEVVGQAGLWSARIDATQLENALLNLAINARDAMPNGGRITIETANKWLDDRGGRERELNPGQYLSICVTDTGTGMPKDIVEKIFDPFFTTKPIGEGTGLGLSMVHGFVRQSGGQVRVYSEIGKGTTMCLYLPRYIGDVEQDTAAETAIELTGMGETVLVIDDEPTVRMLISDVLLEAGYQVLEAQDGPSGLRILESDARIDLLITDVGLPGGMNGRQVADAARVTRPELKVLFVTGFAENAAVGNGHLPPGMAVITKPFQVTEFAAKVREIIEMPAR